MRIELLTGTTNVMRFPVERRARPTLDLLHEIEPDVREVLQVAESFQLPLPGAELRDAVDEEVAEHILNHVRPEPGEARQAELDAILAPIVAKAVQACREAHDAALVATEAQEQVVRAQSEGGYWLQPLTERADSLTTEAARLLVEAHVRAEEAKGSARAVELAKRSETWTVRSPETNTSWLIEAGRSAAG